MDRREALKRIGVGGALVATGPMIMSSPAFALDQPTVTTQPSLPSFTKLNGNEATLVVNQGAATCPASSTTSSVVVSVTATTSDVPETIEVTDLGGGIFNLFKSNAWKRDEVVTVTVQITYSCTYGSGTTSTCLQLGGNATSTGNGNSGGFSTFSQAGAIPC